MDRIEGFWMCYVEGTDGGKHHRHRTFKALTKEAERLARKEGKPVYLLECIAVCTAPTQWEIPLWK